MYSLAMARDTGTTVITRRGQTVVPAAIRRRHGLEDGARLYWVDDGETIRVVPMPEDPVAALEGSGAGENLVESLLRARAQDRARED